MNFHAPCIRASGDPTAGAANAFDAADERLSELEDARAELESDVEDLTKELQDKQRELEGAVEAEQRQQDQLADTYDAWAEAYNSLAEGEGYTELVPVSEYGRSLVD